MNGMWKIQRPPESRQIVKNSSGIHGSYELKIGLLLGTGRVHYDYEMLLSIF